VQWRKYRPFLILVARAVARAFFRMEEKTMKLLMLACVFVMCGCAEDIVAPESMLLEASVVGAEHALLSDVRQLPLSENLGLVEYDRAWHVAYGDGTEALLIPVEAEDEIRMLVALFRNGALKTATVLGFAETTWFSRSRAETLATYEGWFFAYDLGEGDRRIAAYYEGGQTRDHRATIPVNALPMDLLADGGRFSCLALVTSSPLTFVTPRIFLHSSEEETTRAIAREAQQLFLCVAE